MDGVSSQDVVDQDVVDALFLRVFRPHLINTGGLTYCILGLEWTSRDCPVCRPSGGESGCLVWERQVSLLETRLACRPHGV